MQLLGTHWGEKSNCRWTDKTDFHYISHIKANIGDANGNPFDSISGFADKEHVISFLIYLCSNIHNRPKGNYTKLVVYYSAETKDEPWTVSFDFADLIEFVREFKRFAEKEEGLYAQELLFRLNELAEQEVRLQLEDCK